MFAEHECSLSGNAVDEDDFCAGVDLPDVEHEHFAFRLRDDVAFGDDDDVGELQHWPDFQGCVHAGEVVNDADCEYAADVRGTAVAEAGAFGDEDVKSFPYAPSDGIFDVADEEVVGAELSGKPHLHRNAVLGIALVVKGGETVELDDAYPLVFSRRTFASRRITDVFPDEGGPATVISRME